MRYLHLMEPHVDETSKYWRWYTALITKAANRSHPGGYVEKHHAAPKSVVGENSDRVLLTAREHFVAHAMLARCCIGNAKRAMQRAIHAMLKLHNKRMCRYLPKSSIFFETARIAVNESMKGRKNTWTKGTSDHQKATLARLNKERVWTDEQRAKVRKAAQLRVGEKRSTEAKARMSAAAQTRSAFTLNGVKYSTIAQASQLLGISLHQVKKLKKLHRA